MPLQKDSKGELPFIFTYRDTVVVHGAIAEVVIRGHLLAVLEARDDGSDGVWIYGVQPGDLSACGDTFGETHAEFRQSFTAVLYDIADSSSSEKEFQAAVQAFFDQVNKPVATAWWEAVEAGRAAGLAFAMKKKMPIGSADTPPSLQLGFSVQENTLETGPELAAQQVSSFHVLRLKNILKMLEACAPGFRIEAKKHRQWVTYKGHISRDLPLGEHGKRSNPEIFAGKVKQLARLFELNPECVNGFFPGLLQWTSRREHALE